jgi:hypothetical protein
VTANADDIKVAVCECLLTINRRYETPFIPPTAINWIGDEIVSAVLRVAGGTVAP